MRNRCDVTNGANIETRRSQGTHRRLTTGTRTTDTHIDRTKTMVTRLVGSIHRGLLRREYAGVTLRSHLGFGAP